MMLALKLLVSQLSLVTCIQALGIFIPLDVGPGQSGTCSGWSRVISSISISSQTPFFSVVNPNDGPGGPNSQPSDAFRRCVPLLRPRSNAVVLGHINTETGSKPMSNVQAEIDTYAGWDSSYRPTGIFFDGVSSSANLVSQYKTYTTYARRKGFNFIGLDPGEMPDPGYFDIADLINVYESSYASFDADEDIYNSPSTPASKQSVWLTRAPATDSYNTTISQIVDKGIAAVYISDLLEDEFGIPSQWTSFVADVGKINAVAGSPTSPGTNTTADPPSSITGSTGVSNSPQPTGGLEYPHPSNRPPIGARVGGVIGGLVVLSIVLSIIFVNRRNRRRRDHSVVREEVARPFITSQSSPLQSGPPLLGEGSEKRRISTLGNAQVGTSTRWEDNSTSVISQGAPSSSAVTEQSNTQPSLMTSSTWEGRSTYQASNIEPPPNYSP